LKFTCQLLCSRRFSDLEGHRFGTDWSGGARKYLGRRCRSPRPRRHLHEWRVVSAVGGELSELGAVDQAGRGDGLRLDSQRVGFDGYTLAQRANSQSDIDGQLIVDVQYDAAFGNMNPAILAVTECCLPRSPRC